MNEQRKKLATHECPTCGALFLFLCPTLGEPGGRYVDLSDDGCESCGVGRIAMDDEGQWVNTPVGLKARAA